MARIWRDTDGLADDWPPPRRLRPRWVRWAVPLAFLAMVVGAVHGFGGFEPRRYRPLAAMPGDTVDMDGFRLTPYEAYLLPRTNLLSQEERVRILAGCESSRDDTVNLSSLSRAATVVVDPVSRRLVAGELAAGSWDTGAPRVDLELPPGTGRVPCRIDATFEVPFEPTGWIILQLAEVSYADRTLLQTGTKSWGGSAQEHIFYLPLSRA